MMDRMMELMMGRMSKEEKDNMMDKMMGKFFADMTVEDKQKMMEGVNMMEMMSRMMEGGKEGEMPMMPQCVKIMFSNMPKEKRIDFVLEMVTTLMEQGSVGMSGEEKKDFVAKVVEKVKA